MAKPRSSAPLRRSARVQVRVPVVVSGTLADGTPFSEDTVVLTVSKYGARLKAPHPLKVGMHIKVKPKARREAGQFKVVWVGREGSLLAGEIGIEYVDVFNLFGITFPE